MKTSSRMSIIFLSVVMLCGGGAIAIAGSPYINVPEQQRLAGEAWQHYWRSLSPRQQQLVRKIQDVEEAYYLQHGQHIPITQETLGQLMDAVGAQSQEADFVLGRMQVYIDADRAVDDADRLIEQIMNDPSIW